MSGWNMDYSGRRYLRGNFRKILKKNEIVYFNETVFDRPKKIVWRQTSDRIRATIIDKHWFGNTLQAGVLLDARYDLHYVLALLNSRFLNYIYLETVKEGGRVFPQVKMGKVRALPFRTINFDDKAEVDLHNKLASRAGSMLSLYQKAPVARTPHDVAQFERRVQALASEIETQVCELYGLTAKEIAVLGQYFENNC